MRRSEDREDMENVEAWAEVIKGLLRLVPIEQRAAVLALATKNDEIERKEIEAEATNGLRLLSFDELTESCKDSPGLRHWNAIMRLKSLVVQVFVRRIRNNHSPKDAAQILFAPHPYGSGSRLLGDYLCDLPEKKPEG